MPRSPKPEHPLARALRSMMELAPGGPLTISELARRCHMPRSTVHRHLKGGQPQRDPLEAYAKALGVPLNQLLGLAGYPVPRSTAFEDQIRETATELADLHPDDLALLREFAAVLRRRRQQATSASGEHIAEE